MITVPPMFADRCADLRLHFSPFPLGCVLLLAPAWLADSALNTIPEGPRSFLAPSAPPPSRPKSVMTLSASSAGSASSSTAGVKLRENRTPRKPRPASVGTSVPSFVSLEAPKASPRSKSTDRLARGSVMSLKSRPPTPLSPPTSPTPPTFPCPHHYFCHDRLCCVIFVFVVVACVSFCVSVVGSVVSCRSVSTLCVLFLLEWVVDIFMEAQGCELIYPLPIPWSKGVPFITAARMRCSLACGVYLKGPDWLFDVLRPLRPLNYPLPIAVSLHCSGHAWKGSWMLQYSSVQDRICALGKAHTCSTPSLRSFPNIA